MSLLERTLSLIDLDDERYEIVGRPVLIAATSSKEVSDRFDEERIAEAIRVTVALKGEKSFMFEYGLTPEDFEAACAYSVIAKLGKDFPREKPELTGGQHTTNLLMTGVMGILYPSLRTTPSLSDKSIGHYCVQLHKSKA